MSDRIVRSTRTDRSRVLSCRHGPGPTPGRCSGHRERSDRRCRGRPRSRSPTSRCAKFQRRSPAPVGSTIRAEPVTGASAVILSCVRSDCAVAVGRDGDRGRATGQGRPARRSTVTNFCDGSAVVRGVSGPDRDPVRAVGHHAPGVVPAIPVNATFLLAQAARPERRHGRRRRRPAGRASRSGGDR